VQTAGVWLGQPLSANFSGINSQDTAYWEWYDNGTTFVKLAVPGFNGMLAGPATCGQDDTGALRVDIATAAGRLRATMVHDQNNRYTVAYATNVDQCAPYVDWQFRRPKPGSPPYRLLDMKNGCPPDAERVPGPGTCPAELVGVWAGDVFGNNDPLRTAVLNVGASGAVTVAMDNGSSAAARRSRRAYGTAVRQRLCRRRSPAARASATE
jgi:hypothetical protein